MHGKVEYSTTKNDAEDCRVGQTSRRTMGEHHAPDVCEGRHRSGSIEGERMERADIRYSMEVRWTTNGVTNDVVAKSRNILATAGNE